MFKTKYRVVTDNYLGYEAQFRDWWSPTWLQCNGTNTSATLDKAKELCKSRVVWSSK